MLGVWGVNVDRKEVWHAPPRTHTQSPPHGCWSCLPPPRPQSGQTATCVRSVVGRSSGTSRACGPRRSLGGDRYSRGRVRCDELSPAAVLPRVSVCSTTAGSVAVRCATTAPPPPPPSPPWATRSRCACARSAVTPSAQTSEGRMATVLQGAAHTPLPSPPLPQPQPHGLLHLAAPSCPTHDAE